MIAENLTNIRPDPIDPDLKAYARKLAVRAVLQRAFQLVGPIRPAKRQVAEVLSEPFRGELDTERTLENMIGKEYPDPEDWIALRREQKRVQIALMMDTSLSMSGKKLALAAVAAAVLSLKVPSKDFALIAFEGTAHTLSHLNSQESPEMIVDKIFKHSARGYTNIEAALRAGREELEKGGVNRKVGVLITDGVYTAGANPIEEASLFPRLFVFLTEYHKVNSELCDRMARLGGGRSIPVKGYEDLPQKMLEMANQILR
jgi:Mg-chelatase subunit ChlD